MNFQARESSDTELGKQENDALLLDIGDDSGVGDTAYLSTNNFLWDDRDNYMGRENFVELADLNTVLRA
jgi:hypothetical protein